MSRAAPRSSPHNPLLCVVQIALVLDLKHPVLLARRERVEAAARGAAEALAARREVAVVAGAEELALFGAPGDVAALVRADAGEDLVVLEGQDVDEVLFE